MISEVRACSIPSRITSPTRQTHRTPEPWVCGWPSSGWSSSPSPTRGSSSTTSRCIPPVATGLGKALLQFAEAEARRAGFDAIHLYTHEKMTENLALYSRIGYVEYDRRPQGGFSLVYMRKQLG
jgi:Acetyltransferase (GNAT) family